MGRGIVVHGEPHVTGRLDWLEELDFAAGEPWLRMGISRIPPADWLLPADPIELGQRAELLLTRRDDVLAMSSLAQEAVDELGVMVARHLGLADLAFGGDTLAQIGAAVCEDFCLMVDSGQGPALEAAVVCFPSHWRLGEKLGRSMSGIHAPVSGYEPDLAVRADTFLRRIPSGAVFGRRNWSIQQSDELFVPAPRPADEAVSSPSSVADLPDTAWLRSERQTLRRLPVSGAVVFTIRTQQATVDEVRSVPPVAARLDRWLAEAPEHLVSSRCGVA